ncbi:hypothetical protein GYMLUDRAFT_732912 [Collybiopsis luxurians FD-317 M1]|nr:hypothetical protein GYMLUDRAFT_732912 [Collybiopsis luxurians FD-317 M1]
MAQPLHNIALPRAVGRVAPTPIPANLPTAQNVFDANRFHAEVLQEMVSGNLQVNYADYADTVWSGLHQIMALLLQINNSVGELKRDNAIVFNRGCGSGNTMAFREVPFPNGTLPSQMQNPPLPAILNIDDIRQLTSQQARLYLLHHRIDIPAQVSDRKKKLALAIGCTMTI